MTIHEEHASGGHADYIVAACPECMADAASLGMAVPASPLHDYKVTYTTSSGEKTIHVEALDAIDAKHVAEGLEGEAILSASARKES